MKMPSTYSEPLAKCLAKRRGVMAFTLLEVLIALAIFLMLIVGIIVVYEFFDLYPSTYPSRTKPEPQMP